MSVEKKRLKKRIIIGGILATIAIAGIVSGLYFFKITQNPEEDVFIYGFISGTVDPLITVDPLATVNTVAFSIIDNVAEGLFDYYHVIDGETKIIPKLAESWNWSSNGLNLTCTLRKNVQFHDGTTFNATAVMWNLNRIFTLPINTSYGIIWQLSDGRRIINKTIIIDEYTIKFVLNDHYVPFLSLLSSRTAYMFSPTSTPEDDYIDLATDNLVGTGPFIYDSCELISHAIDVLITNVTFRSNPNYWGDRAKIDKLIFKHFLDNTLRVEAMVSGEIDATYAGNDLELEIFNNTPGLQLVSGISHDFWSIIMNNKIINLTMRKAISYALNYSVFISLFGGTRCLSPITPGMLYSKWGVFNVPYYDIQTARQILKDVGWNGTADLTANNNVSSGNEWEQLVIDGNPLATYNFTYPTGFRYYEKVFNITSNNLKQIGVKIVAANVIGEEYLDILYHPELHRHKVELLYQGWHAPDLDPHNTLRLFNALEPCFNIGQVNDTQLQQWIGDALVEVNETKRENLYYNIQQRLIEELYPVVWENVQVYFDVYGPNVRGIQTVLTNPDKFVLRGVYFE